MTPVKLLRNSVTRGGFCYTMSVPRPAPTGMSGLSGKVTAHEPYPAPEHDQKMAATQQQQQQQPKRRPSRAGTRSVTTLTAAQLERKRANDREAQRAIRQRTKEHIESLERRIAELTANQDSNARFLEIVQRNEELEQENALLRSRLNQTVAALGYTPSGAGVFCPFTLLYIDSHRRAPSRAITNLASWSKQCLSLLTWTSKVYSVVVANLYSPTFKESPLPRVVLSRQRRRHLIA